MGNLETQVSYLFCILWDFVWDGDLCASAVGSKAFFFQHNRYNWRWSASSLWRNDMTWVVLGLHSVRNQTFLDFTGFPEILAEVHFQICSVSAPKGNPGCSPEMCYNVIFSNNASFLSNEYSPNLATLKSKWDFVALTGNNQATCLFSLVTFIHPHIVGGKCSVERPSNGRTCRAHNDKHLPLITSYKIVRQIRKLQTNQQTLR